MDTLMVRRLLKTYKCFKGVYPLDLLPYNLTPPINIIINTDPSYLPGEHWVCVCINKDGYGKYFDSFGLPPLKKEIFNYLQKMCVNGWSYNKIALQNISSETCGHYCVLYIIFRCQGLTNKVFMSQFGRNTLKNDARMKKIFSDFSFARKLSFRKDAK